MAPLFIGSGVALVTPFDKDGKINYSRFKELIEFQIANNTDAIVVCGTTGESSTLTVSERLKLFQVASDTIKKRVPLICGTGSNSTSFSLDFAKEAEKIDIDAHLSVTPYYNKTSQSGIIKHYFTLADNLKKPIILYNVPSRTGLNISAQTYKELSYHKNIVAVKEADTNISKLIKSIVLCDNRLDFYTGNDDNISVATTLGCKGVISVLANVMPSYTHKMAYEGVIGNSIQSSKMQKKIMELVECLFMDVNPIIVKEMMNRLGFDVGSYRLPLVDTTDSYKEIIDSVIYFYKDLIDLEKKI